MSNYIQYDVGTALRVIPVLNALPVEIKLELLSDPEYVVRLDPDSGIVEFGYPSDNEWQLR